MIGPNLKKYFHGDVIKTSYPTKSDSNFKQNMEVVLPGWLYLEVTN